MKLLTIASFVAIACASGLVLGVLVESGTFRWSAYPWVLMPWILCALVVWLGRRRTAYGRAALLMVVGALSLHSAPTYLEQTTDHLLGDAAFFYPPIQLVLAAVGLLAAWGVELWCRARAS